MVISRRLFRTGDSEYLLNGKLCRLRDIQDIFMGTGLGPESYAIIGQERIGQLLSSKPHDRRAIIEEAAGITRFKTKKRLAELRLEQSKQNLARVDDIFEEVTKQVTSLKRQAAKAERYGALRDEMRARLRVVLASKVAAMDAEQLSLAEEIAALSTEIEGHSAQVDALARASIRQGPLAAMRWTSAPRKLQQRRTRRQSSWSARSRGRARTKSGSRNSTRARQAGSAELGQAKQHLDGLTAEREGQRAFLETAAAEAANFRQQAQQKQQQVRDAAQAVGVAEQKLETGRRQAMQLLQQAAQARNQTAQGEEALAALEREASRLATEMAAAHRDLDALGAERGQLSMNFESVTATLERLEQEIAELRSEINGEAQWGGRGEAARRSASRRACDAERRQEFDSVADSRPQLFDRHGAQAAAAKFAGRCAGSGGNTGGLPRGGWAIRRSRRRIPSRRTELCRREELGFGQRRHAAAEARCRWARDFPGAPRRFAGESFPSRRARRWVATP